MDDQIALDILKKETLGSRSIQEDVIRLAGYSNLNSTGGVRIPLANCSDRQIASVARDYVQRAQRYIDGLKAEIQDAIREDSGILIEVDHANRMYDQFNIPEDQRDFTPICDLENIIQYC
jgi:hypothetical protein